MTDPQGPSGGGQLGEIPYLRLPRPEALFARRAERFAELAPEHTLSEYLEFLSRIAKAQLAAWETVMASGPVRPERSEAESKGALSTNGRGSGFQNSVRPEHGSGVEYRSVCSEDGSVRPERSEAESKGEGAESQGAHSSRARASTSGPPGPALSTNGRGSGFQNSVRPEDGSVRPERSEAESKGALAGTWREALKVIVTELSTRAIPAESRAALDRLERASPDELEAIAARVRENATEGADLATGPFVAAALQVEYTDRASRVNPDAVSRTPSGCPVCEALPVAGVVLGDDRLRYLVCSVCATQWHHTRIQCVSCRRSDGLAYYALEGERAASVPVMESVKAEACPHCKAYTKLLYLEKDPRIEPFADDVATLALDLLMAEGGWRRYGVNVFLMPSVETGG